MDSFLTEVRTYPELDKKEPRKLRFPLNVSDGGTYRQMGGRTDSGYLEL